MQRPKGIERKSRFFSQLGLSILAFILSKRAVKLENIMFSTPQHKASEIKIIDFGLATKYLSDEHKKMTDKVGTM